MSAAVTGAATAAAGAGGTGAGFMPSTDYTVVFDPEDPLLNKAQLFGPGGQISY
jgi:hypothetical protein